MKARAALKLLSALSACQLALGFDIDGTALIQRTVVGDSADFPWLWNLFRKRANGSHVINSTNATDETPKGRRKTREGRGNLANGGNVTSGGNLTSGDVACNSTEAHTNAELVTVPKKASRDRDTAMGVAPPQVGQTKIATAETVPKKATEQSTVQDDGKLIPIKIMGDHRGSTKTVQESMEGITVVDDGKLIPIKIMEDHRGSMRMVQAHHGNHAMSLMKIACEMAKIPWDPCIDEMKFIWNNKKVVHPKDNLDELEFVGNDHIRMTPKPHKRAL